MANSYPVATGVPVNECPEFASSEAGSFFGGRARAPLYAARPREENTTTGTRRNPTLDSVASSKYRELHRLAVPTHAEAEQTHSTPPT